MPNRRTHLLSSFPVFVHDGYCLDHGLSGSCTKEMHAVRKLSVWYKIPIWFQNIYCLLENYIKTLFQKYKLQLTTGILIFSLFMVIIPTRLLCQMQVNSSGAEFLSTITKFMKRMNYVIACLRPSQNVKSSIFMGSRAVDGKEVYKKAWYTCEVVVLPCQAIAYLTFSSPPPHLKLPIIYDTLWSVKNRIFSGQSQLVLLIASQRFFDSSIGSSFNSFLVRKVENKSYPCTHKLGERTGQVWRDNSRRVRTHENNSGETVHRLGTIIHSFFCAQSGAGIRSNFWK